MFALAPDRRRKIAAFLSFFVLVQGFVVLGNAQPASAHHSGVTAAALCVEDKVTLTATATSWATGDRGVHPNVIIEARLASSGGDWTQIGTGAFTAGNYTFSISYDVAGNQPGWLDEDVNVRVRTPGKWGEDRDRGSDGSETRYANGGNITSISGATDIAVPSAEDCIPDRNPSCEDAFQLPQIVKDDNPGSGDKTLSDISFVYSNPKEAGEYLNVAVSWSTDQYDVGGIIVKAGPGANTYTNPASGTVFDTVASFGISHVTVCGTEKEQPEEVTLQIGGSCELGDQGVTFSATGYQGVTGVESVTFYSDAEKQNEVDPTDLPGPGTYYYTAVADSGYTITNPTGQFSVTDDCTKTTTVEVTLGQCEFDDGSTTRFSVEVAEGATFTLFDDGGTEVPVPADLAPGDYSWTVTTDPGYELSDTTINGVSQDVDTEGEFTVGECEPLAGLGDYVWFDLDEQGDQDENEPVENVTVTLFEGDGTPSGQSTITDASGYYEFTDLPAGDYYVEFDLPAGFTGFTVQDSTLDGADDTTDSDVDATGRSQTVTLAPGEFNETIDAGLVAIPQCPLEPTEGSIIVDGLYLTPKFRDGNDRSLLSSGDLRYGFQWVTGPVVPAGVYDITLVGYDNHFFFGGGNQPTEQYYLTGFTGAPGTQGTSSAGWISPSLTAGPSLDVPSDADYSPAVTIEDVVVSDTLTHFSTVHYVIGSGESVGDTGSVMPTCVRFEPQTASLGDFVWEDLDRDGIQDLGEPGVEGVEVNLWESDGGEPQGVPVQTTTTDANGEYRFDGLTPGQEYVVQFVNPNGTTYVGFSPQDVGANDAIDSDANPANGITGPVVLDPGEYDPSIDAGLTPTVRPILECWQFDPFEDAYFGYFGYRNEGSGPVPVASVPSTVTPGEFSSAFPSDGVFEPGRSPFYPNAAFTVEWTNFPNNIVWDLDGRTATLGTNGSNCFEPAELGDFVWFDVDGDGIQDDGEPGIEGVTVNLWSSVEGEPGEILLTQQTDADGGYLFGDLPPGDYFVQFVQPAGFDGFTLPNQGGDDAVDSDPDPTTGITPEIELSAGESDLTIDAGLVDAVEILEIGGQCVNDGPYLNYQVGFAGADLGAFTTVDLFFFEGSYDFDANGAGVDDGDLANAINWFSDVPFSGTVVYPGGAASGGGSTYDATALGAIPALDVDVSAVDLSTLTPFEWPGWVNNGDGTWSQGGPFAGIVPNAFMVARVNPLSGEAELLYPARTQNCVPPAAIGDYTWLDVDEDGIQDPDEDPVPDVEVTLFADGVEVATTTTDENGFYEFTGLPVFNEEGESIEYQVEFAPVSGAVFTQQGAGSDPAVDSNADENGLTDPITLEPGEYDDTIDAGYDPEGDIVVSASAVCIADVPYLQYTIIPTNLPPGLTATFTWTPTNGASAQTGANPTQFVQSGQPLSGLLLWAGAAIDPATATLAPEQRIATDWPGWFFDGQTWVEEGPLESDSWVRFQPEIVVSVNPTATIDSSQTVYPPATPRCSSNPPLGSLGDYVWVDADEDGLQGDPDAGLAPEPGVPGVTVTLFEVVNGQEVEVATTVTDADGGYLFTNLDGGDYFVVFDTSTVTELPAPYAAFDIDGFTTQTLGTANGSDADPATGRSGTVALDDAGVDLDTDAGLIISSDVEQEVEEEEESETLPETGYDAGRLALVGMLVLGLGGTLVATTRRREDEETA